MYVHVYPDRERVQRFPVSNIKGIITGGLYGGSEFESGPTMESEPVNTGCLVQPSGGAICSASRCPSG